MSEPLTLAKPEGGVSELMLLAQAPFTGDELKRNQEASFRQVVAAVVRSFHGFGVGTANAGSDKPPTDRHLAYGYLLFPFDKDRPSFLQFSQENKCSEGLSSCGVTVRSLWLLLGARHKLLDPPYQTGTVLTYLRVFSVVSGAFVGEVGNTVRKARDKGAVQLTDKEIADLLANTPKLTRENFDPMAGDSIFINRPGQHISTIVEIKRRTDDYVTYISCDGGQVVVSGDSTCCAIRLVQRKAQWQGNKLVDKFKSDREVTGWSNVMKLPFPEKVVFPFRNVGRLDLPDPAVLE